MGCGGFIGDAISDTVDFIGDTVSDTVDFVEDAVSDLGDFVEDTVDFFEDIGDFVEDFAKGIEFLVKGALEGDLQSIAMIAVVAYTGYVGWEALITNSGLIGIGGALEGLAAGAFTLGEGLIVSAWIVGTVATMYSLVMTADMIKNIGELSGMQGLMKTVGNIQASMSLAHVNSWINGSMNMWMAGGLLYDAPKAGDLKFNVTGSQATTRFLGMQGQNDNTWSEWTEGKYHNFHKKAFGNLAGDMFFSVSPVAQRM